MNIQELNDKLCEAWKVPMKYEVHYTYFEEPMVEIFEDISTAQEHVEMFRGALVEVYPKLYIPENLIEVLKIINDVLGRVNICSAYTGNGQYIFEEYVFMHCLAHLVNNKEVFKLVQSKHWK